MESRREQLFFQAGRRQVPKIVRMILYVSFKYSSVIEGMILVIKLKITHWSYGGSVEKIITFSKVGEQWQSTDGDITVELIAMD